MFNINDLIITSNQTTSIILYCMIVLLSLILLGTVLMCIDDIKNNKRK